MIDSKRVDVLIIIDENKIFEVDNDTKNEIVALLKKRADMAKMNDTSSKDKEDEE